MCEVCDKLYFCVIGVVWVKGIKLYKNIIIYLRIYIIWFFEFVNTFFYSFNNSNNNYTLFMSTSTRARTWLHAYINLYKMQTKSLYHWITWTIPAYTCYINNSNKKEMKIINFISINMIFITAISHKILHWREQLIMHCKCTIDCTSSDIRNSLWTIKYHNISHSVPQTIFGIVTAETGLNRRMTCNITAETGLNHRMTCNITAETGLNHRLTCNIS